MKRKSTWTYNALLVQVASPMGRRDWSEVTCTSSRLYIYVDRFRMADNPLSAAAKGQSNFEKAGAFRGVAHRISVSSDLYRLQ